MTCTFFGHKDTPKEIEPTLRSTLIDLIENKNVDTFYIGNNGNFDSIAHNILSELVLEYSIKYYIVLAYMPKVQKDSEHTILPEGIETVPFRFAISYRNKWMVQHSDYAVTFVAHSWGGAAKFKEFAEKNNKIIISLTKTE